MSFVAIAVGLTAITGVGTVTQAVGARKAGKKAKDVAQQNVEATEKLERDEAAKREQTLQRMKKRRGVTAGKDTQRPTVVTGPLGIPGAPSTSGKKLLGL